MRTKIPIRVSIKSWMMKILIGFFILFFSSCQFKSDTQEPSLLDINDKQSTVADSAKVMSEAVAPPTEKKAHYGIDVSHFQGDVVEKLNSSDHLRFVICKATQGITYTDPDFRNNWKMIKQQGLIRGTYHFYMCTDDPIKQAVHFASTASGLSAADIAPVLDIEQGSMSSTVSAAQMEKDILLFLKTVEEKMGRKPIVYTNYSFAQEHFKNPELAEYDLWLAEYSNAKQPKTPDLWKDKGYKIWQKSAAYSLDSEKTDYDEFIGVLEELTK